MSRELRYDGMIAPCGMNCGLCIGHLREKKPCGGCFRKDDKNKPNGCRSCSVVNCEYLAKTESGFCFDCPKYPCQRVKTLDKRYRTKYGMSMFENLHFIKEKGLDNFLTHLAAIYPILQKLPFEMLKIIKRQAGKAEFEQDIR